MRKTAVVTGGGTGIGKAIAAALVARDFDVVITGRRADVLADTAIELAPRVRAVPFDAADPDAITAALPALPGSIDVLVNNAGGNTNRDNPAPGDLAGVKAEWLASLEANLITAVLVTEALRPRFAEGVRVISLSSIAAVRGGGDYAASKAAVVAWNFDLARVVGRLGGTANVVSPGLVEDTEFFGDTMTEERRARLIGQTFTGRAGVPADIAETVAFLASPGSAQLTGQVLHVNGGAHLAT